MQQIDPKLLRLRTLISLLPPVAFSIAVVLCAGDVCAQANEQWIADANGCKAWNPNPVPNESIIWSGRCNNGFLTGPGTLGWYLNGNPNGRNTGTFEEGKQTGKGTFTRANGDKVEGTWENGKLSGPAVLTKADRLPVSGSMVDGKFSPYTASPAEKDAVASAVDAIAPRDIVTGRRSLNLESEQAELDRATTQAAQLLGQARAHGAGINTDRLMHGRLQSIMSRIARVSHRPGLPWEIHLLEVAEVNAFTIGGGKLFFLRGVFGGLINSYNDDEIAAVMAHEIAHVNLRHVGKSEGMAIGRRLVSNARPGNDSMYRASFSTLQEDEADKVGLLYMSLAGFDPSAASRIWARAHQKYGSNPGNYTYDHSLNADRLRKVASLTPMAFQYFKGSGVQNPDYERLRSQNNLIPRISGDDSESGGFAILEAGLGIFTDALEAKTEQRSRQNATKSVTPPQQLGSPSARIANFRIANTNTGKRAFFGEIQNTGRYPIKAAKIVVHYQDAAGRSLHGQQVQFPEIFLQSGNTIQWSGPLLNVPGATRVIPVITSIQ